MSGHSKWATTKHRKAAQDAKRSALFSKLSRNITVAAKKAATRIPTTTHRSQLPSKRPRATRSPRTRSRSPSTRASGSGKDAANYETVVYEGYGPAGVAVYREALTDNLKPHAPLDVRSAVSHAGGNLGTSGSVAFQFERKGQVMVPKEVETGDKKNPVGPNGAAADEEEFMLAVADAGADDYEDGDYEWIVYTAPTDLMAVKRALEEAGIATKGAEMTMEPTTPTQVSVSDAKKVMRLVDKLEVLEDLAERVPHHGHHRRDRGGARRRVTPVPIPCSVWEGRVSARPFSLAGATWARLVDALRREEVPPGACRGFGHHCVRGKHGQIGRTVRVLRSHPRGGAGVRHGLHRAHRHRLRRRACARAGGAAGLPGRLGVRQHHQEREERGRAPYGRTQGHRGRWQRQASWQGGPNASWK